MGYGRNRKVGKSMKAILVIDMPNSCYECDYCGYATIDSNEGDEYTYRSCALSQRYIGEIEESYKDSLCPLKPMPQKKVLDEELFNTGNFRLVFASYTGWNECIDEILGE